MATKTHIYVVIFDHPSFLFSIYVASYTQVNWPKDKGQLTVDDSLKIFSVQVEDSGDYMCMVTEGAKTRNITHKLIVEGEYILSFPVFEQSGVYCSLQCFHFIVEILLSGIPSDTSVNITYLVPKYSSKIWIKKDRLGWTMDGSFSECKQIAHLNI